MLGCALPSWRDRWGAPWCGFLVSGSGRGFAGRGFGDAVLRSACPPAGARSMNCTPRRWTLRITAVSLAFALTLLSGSAGAQPASQQQPYPPAPQQPYPPQPQQPYPQQPYPQQPYPQQPYPQQPAPQQPATAAAAVPAATLSPAAAGSAAALSPATVSAAAVPAAALSAGPEPAAARASARLSRCPARLSTAGVSAGLRSAPGPGAGRGPPGLGPLSLRRGGAELPVGVDR